MALVYVSEGLIGHFPDSLQMPRRPESHSIVSEVEERLKFQFC